VTARSTIAANRPCPDDAGMVWCDDCAWPEPGRCPAPP
jgi:hypothetical protein